VLPEDRDMSQLFQRYLQYRRVGFGRLDALRYAWLVAAAWLAGVAPRPPLR
jgi:hypothetical protein